jgi:preprotein translocase subunit SecE
VESLKRFRQFVIETWAELKKTSWPEKKEVTGTTMVVIITVLICAAYLFVVDFILKEIMEKLLSAF